MPLNSVSGGINTASLPRGVDQKKTPTDGSADIFRGHGFLLAQPGQAQRHCNAAQLTITEDPAFSDRTEIAECVAAIA
jgi:hypothetical protein